MKKVNATIKNELMRKNLDKFEKLFNYSSWLPKDEDPKSRLDVAQECLGKQLTNKLIENKLATTIKLRKSKWDKKNIEMFTLSTKTTTALRNALTDKYKKNKIDKKKFLELATNKLEPTDGIHGPDVIKYAVWKKRINKNPRLKKYMHNKIVGAFVEDDADFYRSVRREM